MDQLSAVGYLLVGLILTHSWIYDIWSDSGFTAAIQPEMQVLVKESYLFNAKRVSR